MFGTRIQTEVFTRGDIQNTLVAMERANCLALQAAGINDNYTRGFQDGYQAAVTTIALVFGLIRPTEAAEEDKRRLLR